ncbi:uncharacterized protein [Panulirus ornatus]|uniref:uncharacterized protein isoform X1 n=1 Tax=Panulirus ornatus TaxID=150431 RepID=UPI003A85C74A
MSSRVASRPTKAGVPLKPKRRCITLSLGEKLRLLEKIDAGGRLRNLMAEFGISKTTFYDIQRDRDKLRAYAKYQEDPEVVHKKRITSARYEALEQTLFEWYRERRAATVKVRGIDIQAAAESLAPQLGIVEFKASYGWLRNFQDRYGIKKRKVMREQQPAATAAAAAARVCCYPERPTRTTVSHWVGPGDVETVLCEEENEASEAQEDNSNSAHEELMVTTVDGKPIKDEVVEWMDEDLEASDGVSSVEGEIRKLQHLPLDSLPIQIKNISGSQGRSRGPPTAKDQMAAVVKAIQHDKESVQTPETTSVHRYAAAAPDHILDEEEELFGRYIAAAIRKLSGKSKSLAKMRIQKVLFHLEQSDRESREEKTEKSSDKSSEPSSLHQEAA